MNALIVDDDDAIRAMVSKMLEREKIETTTARDGREAIDILETRRDFDVILLDLMMPRVDGFGVIQFMREQAPALLNRVVVMTAFTAAAKDKLEPTCRVLSKPFDFQELVEAVQECVVPPPPPLA